MSFIDDIVKKGSEIIGGETKADAITIVVPVKEAAPVVQKIISVDPSVPLSVPEVIGGIGLGLTPFLILPVLAFNAAKGLVKPPRPLPVPAEPTTTVGAYTKSLGEGLSEGFKELFTESNADTDLTKKGIFLSLGGFTVSAIFGAVLFITSQKPEVVKKPITPAAIVKVVPPAVVAPAAVVAPGAVPPSVAPLAVAAPAAAVVAPVAAPKVDEAAVKKAAEQKAASEKVYLSKYNLSYPYAISKYIASLRESLIMILNMRLASTIFTIIIDT
jgi:hypothetical protein